MKRAWLVAGLAGLFVGALSRVALAGGPVVLAGHDPDDHGFESVYADLFDQIYSNVTNGKLGILVVGADVGSDAADWIAGVESLMTVDQGGGTFVNDAAISSDLFNVNGGISSFENSLLTACASDVASFVNGGGGLFGSTQGGIVADPYRNRFCC